MNAILLLAAVLNVSAGTSLQDAFDRVAAHRAVHPDDASVEVVFAPGEYPQAEAAVLTPAAGGDSACCVVYRSADPAHPAVVSGGRRITGWQVGTDGVWRVTLPEVKARRWNFTRLFADGVRRFRPRFPAEGYSLTVSNILCSTSKWGGKMPNAVAGFAYRGDAIDPNWANREDLELFNLQKWNASRQHVKAVDAAARTVLFTAPRYNVASHSAYRKTRFWVENVKEMFGKPGEWYLDRPTGVLAYRPLPGERPETTVVEAPVAERLLLVRGEPGRNVANVVFRDLVFRLDGHAVPAEGSFVSQTAYQVPAAVELVRAQDIGFVGCVMTQLGGYAFGFGPGARDCRVEETLMRDLGGGGVKLGSPYKGYADLPTDDPNPTGERIAGFAGKAWDLTHHITVRNCRVTGGGRVFPDAVGLLCLRASHNRFLHNEIDDLYYSGVSVGFDWSGAPTMAHHNEIAYNHIHDLGQRLLSDMGFVYLLGRAPGTTVHHNFLHDISVFAYGGSGIYPDESSAGVEVHHNLVRNALRGYHQNQNGGERNRVHDNVFLDLHAYLYDYTVFAERPGNVELEMTRNVFVWVPSAKAVLTDVRYPKGRSAADMPVPFGAGLVASSNVYWRTDGWQNAFAAPAPCDLAGWRRATGTDSGSVYADPQVDDLPNGGVRFRPGSPAKALGVEVLDVDETGPTGGRPKCAAHAAGPVPPLCAGRSVREISNGILSLRLDEATAAFSVTDRRTAREWPALSGASAWTRVFAVDASAASLSFTGEASNVAARVRVTLALSNDTLRVTLSSDPGARMSGALAYPAPFADRCGDRNLLPYGSGYAFPAEQIEMGERFNPKMTCYSREFKMGLFGAYAERVAADGEVIPAEGYMAVVETPCNVVGSYDVRGNGLRQFGIAWAQDMLTWGHDRVIRYEFLDRGGPMEIARRYRAEMKRRGYLRTFAEKAARHPEMRTQYERIARSPSVWYWAVDGGKAEVCRALRETCGFQDFLFQFASRKDLGTWVTPEETAACAKAAPGVLLSEYDIYKDTMEKGNLPLIEYVRPYWSIEAADNDDIVYDSKGRPVRGWPVALKGDADGMGKGLGCATICEKMAPVYARKRIAAELKRHPSFNARYLDVSGMCLGECWHPRHRISRRESLDCRRALLRLVTDEFRLLTSSEDGVECFVPECDYFTCGFSAPDAYRVDGGRWMWKIYDGEPPDAIRRGTDEKTRLPLWEMVFHDCTVAYWDWCDYNNKFPKIWWKRDLFNALCGTPPLYFFNEETWPRFRDRLKPSYNVTTPIAKATYSTPISRYRILTPDRSVQRCEFENGVASTVNFGERPFTMKDGFVLPPHGHRFEIPFHCRKAEDARD